MTKGHANLNTWDTEKVACPSICFVNWLTFDWLVLGMSCNLTWMCISTFVLSLEQMQSTAVSSFKIKAFHQLITVIELIWKMWEEIHQPSYHRMKIAMHRDFLLKLRIDNAEARVSLQCISSHTGADRCHWCFPSNW